MLSQLDQNASRGSITFIVLIGIIILASIMLVNGIFPKYQQTPMDTSNSTATFVPDLTGYSPGSKALQLGTIPMKQCNSVMAADLVLDRSGSMNDSNKLVELKKAVSFFIGKLSDDDPIGIQTFATDVTDDVPIAKYGDVKTEVSTTIANMRASGATSTRDALILAENELSKAVPQYPDRKFVMILATDGIPESQTFINHCMADRSAADCQANCQGNGISMRCFAPNQDPTVPPDISQQIKALGVQIYSIAILDAKDARFNTQLMKLLKTVASPNSFYIAPSSSDLSTIYQQIGSQMCQPAS